MLNEGRDLFYASVMSYLRKRLIPYETGLRLLERAGVNPRGGRVRLSCDDHGLESWALEFDCLAGTVALHQLERLGFRESGIYGLDVVERLYQELFPILDLLLINPRALPQSREVSPG